MKDVHRLGLVMSSFKRVFGSAWGRAALALSVALTVLIGTVPAQAVAPVDRTTQIVRVKAGAELQVRDSLQAMAAIPSDEITNVFDGFIVRLADFEVQNCTSLVIRLVD